MTKAKKAQSADRATVVQLHSQWVDLLDKLTGSPIGHHPPIPKDQMRKMVTAARGLEELIADTPSQTIAEVRLKLTMAGSAGVLTKCRERLVDSASCDLRQLDPSFRLLG